jgi:PAS domain S-box-containing protein
LSEDANAPHIDDADILRGQLDALRQHLDGLRASFNETFDEVGIGIAFVDLDGYFIEVNSAFSTMLGYSEAELVGRRFKDFTHDEDVGENLTYLELVRRGDLASYRMDKRYRRANGDLFWADLVVRAHLGENGLPVKLISAITDITERKQFEERQKFLLGELAHRTKNLVAVISAITTQTAKTAESVPAMAEALTSRLAGIGASQAALTNAGTQEAASLRDLCKLQLATFIPADDARVSLSGPDLRLGPSPAGAIGMALHELTTNALKYGALSSVAGAVEVTWHVCDAGHFEIVWQEAGGPIVHPPTRTGFGRQVVEQLVGTSTNGEVRIDYLPEGLRWRLRAPAQAILAR